MPSNGTSHRKSQKKAQRNEQQYLSRKGMSYEDALLQIKQEMQKKAK
jgi:DNA polymerase III delta prime subunit